MIVIDQLFSLWSLEFWSLSYFIWRDCLALVMSLFTSTGGDFQDALRYWFDAVDVHGKCICCLVFAVVPYSILVFIITCKEENDPICARFYLMLGLPSKLLNVLHH